MLPLPSHPPVRVFYSYSHKDERLRERLQAHLALLRRQGVIADWHDRKIGPGYQWEDAIDEHLEAAQIILLLISADFLASDYCYDKEMQRALAKHKDGSALVIPIILRPVDWMNAPFRTLQTLPPNGKPVTMWRKHDEAWVSVSVSLRLAIETGRIPGYRLVHGDEAGETDRDVEDDDEEPPEVPEAIQSLVDIYFWALEAVSKADLLVPFTKIVLRPDENGSIAVDYDACEGRLSQSLTFDADQRQDCRMWLETQSDADRY